MTTPFLPVEAMPHDAWRKTNLPKPVHTLDLHGCSKSEAISHTTDFLERSNWQMDFENAWVLIITGSGAHSIHGPVLRGAVETLLIKRKIEYYQMKGKGSFLVNAASGFVLYEPPQPIDSKVIVASNTVSTRGKILPLRRNLSENQKCSKALKKEFYNRSKEMKDFDEAISRSLEEKERIIVEDKELLSRALNLSLQEKRKQSQEEKELFLAKKISKSESTANMMKEDEEIRNTLALSKMEFDCLKDPDACIQRAIELSRKESQKNDEEMFYKLDCTCSKHDREQEDDEFLKVLELSMAEF